MKTNKIMIRKMGSFDVLQRTTDSYFDANALMHQWNSIKGNSKREMKRFLTSPKTIAFIDEIDKREAQSQKSDMAIGQQVIISKGKNTKDGKTTDKVWLSPLLFIDFAMWINPAFKYDVLNFVYDQFGNNLLLLPKDIHQKYHRIESFFNNIKIGSNKFFDFSTSPYVIMFTEKHNILEISNVIYYFSDLKTQQQHEILLAKKNKRNPIMFYQHEINKYLISHEI